ncbi:MAG: hypothetical protein ACTJG2_03350 [Candidatus Saccharimonadales bacterium]
MLRDYHYTENWRLLDGALEQFIDLPPTLKLVQYICITPDSFLWKIASDETVYYLYVEDYIEGLVSVRESVAAYAPEGVVLTFLPAKKSVALENSTSDQEASIHQPSGKEHEIATFSRESGYDSVFLMKSDEAVNDVISDHAKFKEMAYDYRSVPIARDVLQLAETASLNHDSAALYSVQQLVGTFQFFNDKDAIVSIDDLKLYIDILLDAEYDYEFHSETERKQVGDALYRQLSRQAQDTITANKHTAKELHQTVVLVTAMYAKREADMTRGTSIALIVSGDSFEYPKNHFLNDELRTYLKENAYISEMNIQYHIPEQLDDYMLVEGSEETRRIFRRELGHISW